MTTLTLNEIMTTEEIIARTVFSPSIPRYMESSLETAAILTRNVNEIFYTEKWCAVNAYIDYADGATDFEVEAYLSNHQHDDLDMIDDIPEPLNVHDQDIWLECTVGEYDDFVEEFNQYVA